jgi:hypothetical protein
MSEAVVTSDTVEPPQKKVGFVKAPASSASSAASR